jgi:hypothetical protein
MQVIWFMIEVWGSPWHREVLKARQDTEVRDPRFSSSFSLQIPCSLAISDMNACELGFNPADDLLLLRFPISNTSYRGLVTELMPIASI